MFENEKGDRRRNRTLRDPGKEPGTLPLRYTVWYSLLIWLLDGSKVRTH